METMIIGGVVFDQSVLLVDDETNPAAVSLLHKLRHSALALGISYGPHLSSSKVSLLKKMETVYSMDCFRFDSSSSSTEDSISELQLAWPQITGSILYLLSNINNNLFQKLTNCGWQIAILNNEGTSACEGSNIVHINKLDELPLTICRFNRKAIRNSVLTVGYVMKPSREEDFAKRGAFPMSPTHNGLMFLPLSFELPLPPQLQEVDIVLHKATDEIISIELSRSTEYPDKIVYTTGMQELKRYMDQHIECCVIDPLDNIYPVLDRLKIQQILLGLDDLKAADHHIIRAPHFLKVDNFNEPDFVKRLTEAKLSLPCIVKPQVACGVADAHSMAIVFKVEDFEGLSVPLPAVVQEYVDHSSTLYKFYVLGDQVFHAVKKSTPNAEILMKLSGSDELKPLLFDSLKSLPTGSGNQHNSGEVKKCMDESLVKEAAKWLSTSLCLTIFGFDVVVEEGSGDHVIVDVNYLPSFKEVPDDIAIPAFWDAIKLKFQTKKHTI
ncbi:hypothetical protein UlMin_011058 [Ulmus minor]